MNFDNKTNSGKVRIENNVIEFITNQVCDHDWSKKSLPDGCSSLYCSKCGSYITGKDADIEDYLKHHVCQHEWRACSKVDVEGCYGSICIKCGKLSCACEIREVDKSSLDHKVFWSSHDGKLIGDYFYDKFYKKD